MNEIVKEYYGNILSSSDDLKTDACCTDTNLPAYMKEILADIHDEVMARYYGCGLIAPEDLEGLSILDLGSGSGRDAYVLSRLVGEKGRVVGVDMTDEQLAVANAHLDYHRVKYGYDTSNVTFLKGYLEELDQLGLEPNSFDVIVSNCVINLCSDKPRVLKAAYDLLKPGGELYFSDVYSDRRIPQALQDDPVLYGECLSGALYWNDFLTYAIGAGFQDPRLVEDRPLLIGDPAVQEKIRGYNFYSATYRLFKVSSLEKSCEDYGQAVIYKGTIPHHPEAYALDGHHHMETGRVFPVCRNTYEILHNSRFQKHFEFIGDDSRHFGIFPGCGTNLPFNNSDVTAPQSGGCC